MSLPGGMTISWKQVAALLTFVLLALDAVNGFAGFFELQPFATKNYVAKVVESQLAATVKTLDEVNGRLSNLQLMSLDMSLQLIDGQLFRLRGEQVEWRAKLVTERPASAVADARLNIEVNKRIAEVQASIDDLLKRRELIICYRDKLLGMNRTCG